MYIPVSEKTTTDYKFESLNLLETNWTYNSIVQLKGAPQHTHWHQASVRVLFIDYAKAFDHM